MTFGARALIRLGALQHNLSVVRQAAPDARVMAVIKANAYGHGLVPVARSLSAADSLAVARIPEALRLTRARIDKNIVLLSGVLTSEELKEALSHRYEIVVHCREQIELLERARSGTTTVWAKFDTGMNRLGFSPGDAQSVIDRLRACARVSELRLMSHFASADEPGSADTRSQFDQFRTIVANFKGDVSIANTPATLGWPDLIAGGRRSGGSGHHWIRPGVALFGISPFAGRTGKSLGLKPVMRFEARLIAIKPLQEGARVGYKGRYVSPRDTMLGIISAGYGDGYTRHFRDGTPVLLNGRRVPLIGNVSMDLIAVDLGPGATDRVGDIATLWGGDLPVEEVAPWADAIPYELVCGVMNREASELTD